MKPIVNRF